MQLSILQQSTAVQLNVLYSQLITESVYSECQVHLQSPCSPIFMYTYRVGVFRMSGTFTESVYSECQVHVQCRCILNASYILRVCVFRIIDIFKQSRCIPNVRYIYRFVVGIFTELMYSECQVHSQSRCIPNVRYSCIWSVYSECQKYSQESMYSEYQAHFNRVGVFRMLHTFFCK